MPVTTWAEVRWALVGCLRLARGDRGGLACFDRSLDGFWRSFTAAFLGYPLFLLLLMMRVSLADWNATGGAQIILIETIGYVISWVAFPLVMLSVLRWIGREQRYFDFMVPYNWCQLPQSALAVVVGLQAESGLVGDPLSQTIVIAGVAAVFLYEWYVARVALEIRAAAATMIVLIDFVLGELVTRAAGSLY
jgi:hypothetical protein